MDRFGMFASGVLALFASSVARLVAQDAAAKTRDATMQRLEKFVSQVEGEGDRHDGRLTEDDFDLLVDAQVNLEGFTPDDAARLLAGLRFVHSLRDDELSVVEEYTLAKGGEELRLVMLPAFVQRLPLDRVAKVIVAVAADLPEESRSYGTWKLWGTCYERRDDYYGMTRDLSLELIRLFESGTDADRKVIAGIFDKPGMTKADLPALRVRATKGCEAGLRERDRLLAIVDEQEAWQQPAQVWIEDRRGLRLMGREAALTHRGGPTRYEVRLTRGREGEAWGTLADYCAGGNDFSGSGVRALHATLRDLTLFARDESGDFESKLYVVRVYLAADAESPELRSRIERLDAAMRDVVSVARLAAAVAEYRMQPEDARVAQARAIATDTLGAVRLAAPCTAALTAAKARTVAPDAVADTAALAALEKVKERATTWLGDVAKAKDVAGATRSVVRVHAGEATVVAFQDGSDGRIQSVRIGMLSRDLARRLEFRTETEGPITMPLALAVPKRKIPMLTCSVLHRPSLYGAFSFVFSCSSETHREQLLTELKQFASGQGR